MSSLLPHVLPHCERISTFPMGRKSRQPAARKLQVRVCNFLERCGSLLVFVRLSADYWLQVLVSCFCFSASLLWQRWTRNCHPPSTARLKVDPSCRDGVKPGGLRQRPGERTQAPPDGSVRGPKDITAAAGASSGRCTPRCLYTGWQRPPRPGGTARRWLAGAGRSKRSFLSPGAGRARGERPHQLPPDAVASDPRQ